jgi:hypothetical protein
MVKNVALVSDPERGSDMHRSSPEFLRALTTLLDPGPPTTQVNDFFI